MPENRVRFSGIFLYTDYTVLLWAGEEFRVGTTGKSSEKQLR